MPKSSSDSDTPIARSSAIWASTAVESPIMTLSVSSTSSQRGARPLSCSAARTTVATLPALNWLAETFTATRTGARPAFCQAMLWKQAWRITHSPIGRIRPVSSASGMKSAGETWPISSLRQRSSASMPTTRSSMREICGW